MLNCLCVSETSYEIQLSRSHLCSTPTWQTLVIYGKLC